MRIPCGRFAQRLMASLAASCAAGPLAHADEPLFGYTFTTDLLPQGGWEIEQWLTWREGKAGGRYHSVEGSTEYQYGLTDAIQIAGYVNYQWAQAHDNNVIDGTTLLPGGLAGVAAGPHENVRLTKFTGVSGELIYRVLSPYLDPLGVALYVKPTIGPGLRELNSRLILQKNFLDDQLVLAANIILVEQTRFFHASDRWSDSSAVHIVAGASYRFIANWSAAFEILNEREWTGLSPFSASRRTNSAYYMGPSIHYADTQFFATLTVLGQMPWADDFANPEPDFVVGDRNYAANFERFRVRLKFGVYFGGQA